MVDDKLAREEAQRAANYEAAKAVAQQEVDQEIAAETHRVTPSQSAQVEDIARGMKQKVVSEVGETEREVGRARVVARISQVVDYIFFLIYGLLAIRLLLELFGARESAGFVKFVKSATGLVYAPFQGIVPSPSTPEGFTLALPVIVAIVVYMIFHLAINGFLRMIAHRKTEV